jgi:hypothetical protein
MLAVTPFLFSIVLAGLVVSQGWWLTATSLFAGAACMFAIHAFLVPLVPRGT